jgi:hypothetical protein
MLIEEFLDSNVLLRIKEQETRLILHDDDDDVDDDGGVGGGEVYKLGTIRNFGMLIIGMT